MSAIHELTIAKQICQFMLQQSALSPVLEFSAGNGILTELLLRSGVRHLASFTSKSQLSRFEEVRKKYSVNEKQFTYREDSYYSFRKKFLSDKTSAKEKAWQRQLLSSISVQPWKSDVVPLKVFSVLNGQLFASSNSNPDWKSLAHLVRLVPSRQFLYKHGRTECYFFVSSKTYRNIISPLRTLHPQSRSISVLLANIYDITHLLTVPCNSFFPPIVFPNRRLKPNSKIDEQHIDNQEMFLIKLAPRVDLMDWVACGPDWSDRFGFEYFVFQLCSGSTPVCEKLCSWNSEAKSMFPYLGLSSDVLSRDLDRQKFVELYKKFMQLPHFLQSQFRQLVEVEAQRQPVVFSYELGPYAPVPNPSREQAAPTGTGLDDKSRLLVQSQSNQSTASRFVDDHFVGAQSLDSAQLPAFERHQHVVAHATS